MIHNYFFDRTYMGKFKFYNKECVLLIILLVMFNLAFAIFVTTKLILNSKQVDDNATMIILHSREITNTKESIADLEGAVAEIENSTMLEAEKE